jgi:hypothetical protein
MKFQAATGAGIKMERLSVPKRHDMDEGAWR